ncbi:hypothetical protein DPSP01_009784 [Paraphaeosphaeria sporulosa]
MCFFPQVTHACGHTALVTHPKAIRLCPYALRFCTQDLDRAPPCCTPLGPHGRDDLYNKDIIFAIIENSSQCAGCHATESRPARAVRVAQSNQSWETEELQGLKLSLNKELENVEKGCQVVEFDQKIRAIVKTIIHPWLRGMLEVNGDGYSSLGEVVLHRVRNVQRLVDNVLAMCNTGVPLNSLRIDFHAAVDQYEKAFNLMDHFQQIVRLLHDLENRGSYQNELCKQAEMCQLFLQGPQVAPHDLAYLQPGFKTPNAFQPKRDSGVVPGTYLSSHHALSKNWYASALVNLLKQKDVLPFRREFYHGPSRNTNKRRRTPPAIQIIVSDEEPAKFPKPDIKYWSHAA